MAYRFEKPPTKPLFEQPFEFRFDPNNRWVILAQFIDWLQIDQSYRQTMTTNKGGGHGLSSRVVVGAMIIKHIEKLSDEHTIAVIQENPYMQYFLGLSSFSTKPVFDPSLFVTLRKRITPQMVSGWVDSQITQHKDGLDRDAHDDDKEDGDDNDQSGSGSNDDTGIMILDATVAPQDIRHPTDVSLLNESRHKVEKLLIEFCDIYNLRRPKTTGKLAWHKYHLFIKNRKPRRSVIRKARIEQLEYLESNLLKINALIDSLGDKARLTPSVLQLLSTAKKIAEQQRFMISQKTNSVPERIVSFTQPYIRPIVRGKARTAVEFGSKLNVMIDQGLIRLVRLGWSNFYEGDDLQIAAEYYKRENGRWPSTILADKSYQTKDNRNWCEARNIRLNGYGRGRPSNTEDRDTQMLADSAKRNEVEGKFGLCKRKYGLDLIKAKLKQTSETWIALILWVANFKKLLLCRFYAFIEQLVGFWHTNNAQTRFTNLYFLAFAVFAKVC